MGLTRAAMTAVAERTGYPVVAAWVDGHGPMGQVEGVILHHTATPASAKGDYPSLGVVRKGTAQLAGPLCNFGLGRSGTVYLVTEGRAFHAGRGSWKGHTDGNRRFLGIEAEHPGGPADTWPPQQMDAYQRLVASILHALGKTTEWDVRHGRWAAPGPDQRKIDPRFPMPPFDAGVDAMLARPSTINRNHPA